MEYKSFICKIFSSCRHDIGIPFQEQKDNINILLGYIYGRIVLLIPNANVD